MNATFSLVMVVLVWLMGFATAQSTPAIYVADPGRNFGPIPVGRVVPKYRFWFVSFGKVPFVPEGWTIKCYIPGGDDATYYYTSYGLRLRLNDPDVLPPEEATEVDVVVPGALRDNEKSGIFLDPDREQCVTPEGRPVSLDARLTRPRDTVYATTKGIQLGASLRDVIAAYGPLARIHLVGKRESEFDFKLHDLREVDPMNLYRVGYCMVTFTMRAGRVENISIDAYRGWKGCTRR